MSQDKETESNTTTKHRKIPKPVFVVLCVVSLLLLLFLSSLFLLPRDDDGDPLTENDRDQNYLSTAASEPLSLRIPSINLTAQFEDPLGIDGEGSVEVPEDYEKVARYIHGPTPGETGPSVILGHVDSLDGPAVFYSLGQVKKGDIIEIDREDGTVAIFKVSKIERVEQKSFPSERVYGAVPYAGVRLITCSGTYDKNKERYSHNLIVYGELNKVKMPTGEVERFENNETPTDIDD